MKISTAGSSRFFADQVSRIDAGFIALGHEMTDHWHDAALVYANDGGPRKQILKDRADGNLKGKVIFTVLDIPEHLFPRFDLDALRAELVQADAVCVISEFVQNQVRFHLGMDSHVVYNPIKSITRNPARRNSIGCLFVHVGRRSDINKRAILGVHALQLLGVGPDRVALVGNEPGWGEYQGVLSDDNLNHVYNHVDFTLCTSKTEGLCLPVLESMAAGVIPVVCNDMTTRQELLPSRVFPEYDLVDPDPRSVALFIAQFMNNADRMTEMKNRLYQHYVENWAVRTSPKGVASAILGVYHSIT